MIPLYRSETQQNAKIKKKWQFLEISGHLKSLEILQNFFNMLK